MEDETTVGEEVVRKNYFNQITSFSKIVSGILFIVFPFVGFWLGLQYSDTQLTQSEALFESSTTIATKNSSHDSENTVSKNTDAKIASNTQTNATFHYVDWENYSKLQSETLDLKSLPDYIHTLDVINNTKVQGEVRIPFFVKQAETETYILLSGIPYGKDGAPWGLVKFDKQTKVLSEMKISEYFHPLNSGSVISPNGKFAATILDSDISLALMDLESDTIKTIMLLDANANERFTTACELGCLTSVVWIDTKNIQVRKYIYESCEATAAGYKPSKCSPFKAEKYEDLIISI